ncbi:CopG family transcriptional regulator [Gordonibacter massiliensis]|nr:CopG family transcriptional regulator [Gordonibacter massiliensis (ex Traore et al. 2017)]
MRGTKITSENLEEMFDRGEDVTEFFDFDSAVVEDKTETKRVNVDFPAWVVEALDREARRIGIGRQAVIKTWIAERLDDEAARRSA